jgi:hypothetical protein
VAELSAQSGDVISEEQQARHWRSACPWSTWTSRTSRSIPSFPLHPRGLMFRYNFVPRHRSGVRPPGGGVARHPSTPTDVPHDWYELGAAAWAPPSTIAWGRRPPARRYSRRSESSQLRPVGRRPRRSIPASRIETENGGGGGNPLHLTASPSDASPIIQAGDSTIFQPPAAPALPEKRGASTWNARPGEVVIQSTASTACPAEPWSPAPRSIRRRSIISQHQGHVRATTSPRSAVPQGRGRLRAEIARRDAYRRP